jgi:hypothetical protein
MRTHNKNQNKHQKTQEKQEITQIKYPLLFWSLGVGFSIHAQYSIQVAYSECLVGKKSPVYQYTSWYEPPAWDGTSLYIPCWILIKTYYHPLMNKSVVSRNKLSFLWIVWIDFLQSELQALHSQPSIFLICKEKRYHGTWMFQMHLDVSHFSRSCQLTHTVNYII